jgi:polyphosphate glucokinase
MSEPTASGLVVGVDIGGTGIKAAPVAISTGEIATEQILLPTPSPATPQAIAGVVGEVLHLTDVTGPVGLAIPAVVRGGIVETASHIDQTWIGVNAVDFFSKVTGRQVAVLNDADAAGIAEVRFGAGRGMAGVVAMITLGTGIGSALFVDGTLFPNSELGHLPLYGTAAENWAAGSVRERDQVDWDEYAHRLQAFLELIQTVLWPQLIIIGGGVSDSADKFLPLIQLRTPIVPARLRNHAGIIGAAMFAPKE